MQEHCPTDPIGCYDIDTDEAHCGPSCQQCEASETCTGGVCGCPPGTTPCGASCVSDLTSNPAHCGACDHACGTARFPGATCTASACDPVAAIAVPGVVGTVAADPITPHRLYAVTTGPTRLVRFSTQNAAAPEDGPVVDVTHVAVGVRGDAVAWAWLGSTSPVWYGSFTAPLTQGADVAGGATFLTWRNALLYWAEAAPSGCLFRDADSPIAFGCSPGQFVDSAAFGATSIVTLSPDASPWMEKIQLPGGARVLENIGGPAVAGDPGSPSIALDATGLYAFYLVTSPTGQLRRFKLGGSRVAGDDELVVDVGGAYPVAVFVAGSDVVWATRDFSTDVVRVQRAQASAALPTAITTVSTFPVAHADTLRSWSIDATGVYFVREDAASGKIYRVAR